MKRFSTIQMAAVVLGVVFVVVGVWTMFHPIEMAMFPPGPER